MARMKRPAFRDAVAWIAYNDAPGDDDPPETLAGYLTVLLVADLFDVPAAQVASAVYLKRTHQRHHQQEPYGPGIDGPDVGQGIDAPWSRK